MLDDHSLVKVACKVERLEWRRRLRVRRLKRVTTEPECSGEMYDLEGSIFRLVELLPGT